MFGEMEMKVILGEHIDFAYMQIIEHDDWSDTSGSKLTLDGGVVPFYFTHFDVEPVGVFHISCMAIFDHGSVVSWSLFVFCFFNIQTVQIT